MGTAGQSEEGSWLSDMISEKRLALVSDFKPRQGDIFIASYPKCGSSWLTFIIYHLLADDQAAADSQVNDVPVLAKTVWLEDDPIEVIDSLTKAIGGRRMIKTHLPFKVMPTVCQKQTDKSVKYVYMARNPKDTAVSYFHHYCLFKSHSYNGDWSDFFDKFIKAEVEFCSWFDHVQGWWEHRNDDSVLFLTYEDMKKDTKKCVELVASFLGISASARAIDTAIEQSAFKKLKTIEASKKLLPDPEKFPDWATNEGHRFIRKGVVGDWKSYFTAKQSTEVDKLYAQLQAKCPGLEFTFDEQ